MFTCHVCGSNSAREESISEVFELEGRRVLVEQIPAQVCERCGEPVFSAATAESIRRVLHGEGQPTGTLTLDVFALR